MKNNSVTSTVAPLHQILALRMIYWLPSCTVCGTLSPIGEMGDVSLLYRRRNEDHGYSSWHIVQNFVYLILFTSLLLPLLCVGCRSFFFKGEDQNSAIFRIIRRGWWPIICVYGEDLNWLKRTDNIFFCLIFFSSNCIKTLWPILRYSTYSVIKDVKITNEV